MSEVEVLLNNEVVNVSLQPQVVDVTIGVVPAAIDTKTAANIANPLSATRVALDAAIDEAGLGDPTIAAMGAPIQWYYTGNNPTPSWGQMGINAATPAAATIAYFNAHNAAGLSLATSLALLTEGAAAIAISATDDDSKGRFIVTGVPTQVGEVVQVPIEFTATGTNPVSGWATVNFWFIPAGAASELADADVAALIDDADSDTRASLDARFAQRETVKTPRGRTFVAFGDSITSYCGTTDNQQDGWVWQLASASKGRMIPAGKGVFATGGFFLQNIIDTHLPEFEALDPAPDVAFLGGGSNDLAQTGGTVYAANPQAAKDRLDEMIRRVEARGTVPVLVMVPPRATVAQISANVLDWNAYIEQVAAQRGFKVYDMYTSVVVDPATAAEFKPGTSWDMVTHPSALGYSYMTRHNIARGILDLFPPAPPIADPTYFTQLVPETNGRFLADGDANGRADGWNLGGTTAGVTFSREAATPGDGAIGYWQVITIPAGAGNGWLLYTNTTDWANGDTLELRGLLKVTGLKGWNSDNPAAIGGGGKSYIGVNLTPYSPTVARGCVVRVDRPDASFYARADDIVASAGVQVRILWDNTDGTTPIVIKVANVRAQNLDRTPYVGV